jgi:hypothetical protein
MNNVIELHPVQAKAINEEMAAYEKREIRLLLEISNLHEKLGGIKGLIEGALGDCMLPNNMQAQCLKRALKLVDAALGEKS